MNEKTKLWGGRFASSTDELMENFSASIAYDKRLYKEDIAGSIAHAQMLQKIAILSQEELSAIEQGLREIEQEIEQDTFAWSNQNEDIHMNIEAELTHRIGEAGKKLHTGRSRNDQVATDMRLHLRQVIDQIGERLSGLQMAIIDFAKSHCDTIMPGYTHMQPAQPVTLGHHLLAWNEMFQRDYERFIDCRKRVNISPLGCAALAGTSFPVDREMTAQILGFDKCATNSLDAVSDRDFVIEFCSHATLVMIHLSRISEELILWSSSAFNFIDLGDGFCTGSSIMPQKKNPDAAEITRGKTGRVVGNLTALLVLMKGQPLAYNRDNQEDKEQLFDTIDTTINCLDIFTAMIPNMKVNAEAMYTVAAQGYTTATDLADYLVRRNMPFRQAHEVVAKAVDYAIEKQCQLNELSLSELKSFCAEIEQDVFDVLSLEGSVNARNHIGGTAPEQVKKAITNALELVAMR